MCLQGPKRPRTGTSDGQAGMVLNPSMSEYGTMEVNNMTGTANDQIGRWGWDDDDKGMGMDIKALLSEFGDFGDFFEDDVLPFGEVILVFSSSCLIECIFFHLFNAISSQWLCLWNIKLTNL